MARRAQFVVNARVRSITLRARDDKTALPTDDGRAGRGGGSGIVFRTQLRKTQTPFSKSIVEREQHVGNARTRGVFETTNAGKYVTVARCSHEHVHVHGIYTVGIDIEACGGAPAHRSTVDEVTF